MNATKVRWIVRREYVESVRKKSFLFGLVATPVMMALLVFLPILSGELVSREAIALAVVDDAGGWGDRLETALADESRPGVASIHPELTIYGPADAPDDAALDAQVADGTLSGWIRLPGDFGETGRFEYRSESITNVMALDVLKGAVERVWVERKARELGISEDRMDALLQPVTMRTIRLGRDGGQESDFTAVYLKAVALVMIMFFALMPTGQILMRSVIEEKANRVIEVLLSSVTPLELMVGKIIGLGAVGLTLLGAWAGAGALLALSGLGRTAGGGVDFPIGSVEIGFFLMYFFPGYFLYAALLGTIGSICTSERDAQPFLTPISLFLIFPVMMGIAIAQSPDHLVARVLSFVPLFTPSLMMFRLAIKEPPVWEVLATWLTLLAGTLVMFGIAARVFRVGILMYGKRPSLPEVLRWIGTR